MKLKFCGAAGTVTGSCHLLELDDGYKILLDTGLYQGNDKDFDDFNSEWLFNPADIDAVILSHAHIDHSGRLPKLVKDGFDGKIYCTHATRDLAAIMLLDSAFIQVRDAEYINKKRKKKGGEDFKKVEPLYEPQHVKQTLEKFVSISYEKRLGIHPDVDFVFKDAGHILGSASVTLRIKRHGLKDTILGFSGDIGRPNRPILKDPVPIDACDYVICESTYGDKFHEGNPQQEDRLLQVIKKTCVENRGKLIIPAFSVGRTQEIVYMIDRLETHGRLPKIPVYVDSPLSTNATEVFQLHPECFDDDILNYMIHDPNPFGFNDLHYIKKVEESKKLNEKERCIIISASGMATAGRIRHHIFNSITNPKNTIMIVGYCAEYTLGAQLARGEKEVRIFGETLPVNCHIEIMNSFSAHGDQKEMMDFLQKQDKKRLRKTFLVHGDPKRQQGFKSALEKEGFDNIAIPTLGQSFDI